VVISSVPTINSIARRQPPIFVGSSSPIGNQAERVLLAAMLVSSLLNSV
jgi:hypothetical protein